MKVAGLGAIKLDEFASIHRWTENRQHEAWQRQQGVLLGIGDDAALVELAPNSDVSSEVEQASGWQLLLAVDTMVETVHFSEATMTEEDVGYKALAANISDIAAMGGLPRHALVSVSVPASYGTERMRRLYDGLYACADQYGVAVVGGDTTSSPQHLVVAVTLTGIVEVGKAVTRAGARAGDAVFVTGPLGMAAAGLHYLLAAGGPIPQEAAAAAAGVSALVRRHRRPEPSVRAGRLLAARGSCRSLNDVSDGLASEAWELAQASGVAIVLHRQQLPLSGSLSAYAARMGHDPLEWMLYGGEDYVLLGTIDRADVEAVKALFHQEGMPFYVIGKVEEGRPAVWMAPDEQRDHTAARSAVPKRGYNHFGTESSG